MRKDLLLSPWTVRHTGTELRDDFPESIFFTGNGRMGVRGYLPCGREALPVKTGLYVAGIFGRIKPGITDFVNLPTPFMEEIAIDGGRAAVASPVERELDMRSALLTMGYCLRAKGKAVRVEHQRFFPKERTGLCLQRTKITALADMQLSLFSGIMTGCCNSPIPDDQTKENSETVQLSALQDVRPVSGGFSCDFAVTGSGLRVTETALFRCSREPAGGIAQQNGAVGLEYCVDLQKNREFVLDKLCCVRTSRDVDPRIDEAPRVWDYGALFREHKSAWQEQWEKCDITLGDEELQCALRFSQFNLICSCSGRDDTVSIGARGLTHGRYKGCYFWDTDMFMLPFFIHTDREAAKNLCRYRVNTLPAARENAKKMNADGARYPWMAALDGIEQCETWDIGCSEVHITADVVYALDQYCRITGDRDFYIRYAAQVYVETARFWQSRYTYHPETDTADLLFCKGPDEYCGITSNNLYTNVMVQHNLALACKAAEDLRDLAPEKYAALGLSESEAARWRHLRRIIPWPRDPNTGRLTTDDTFHRLEPVDISLLKPDARASYHRVCFDRLQRYKVVKQADVLLLMTRLPELFTPEERLAAWEDFEPLCLHDSTLSFASHALFAAQNGLFAPAKEYLKKALLLDLRDIMGNTGKEGLHLACMGEAWQAVQCLKQAEERRSIRLRP